MWYWMTLFILVIVLIAVLEELIYYFWNRYVYGKRQRKHGRWYQKAAVWFTGLKRKRQKDLQSNITNDIDSP
ncbi:hypothetical protein [Neobacillus kokaensis]|uniref:Uncharacterized protein n=1 Tax=Neobacillus kokaensis TaxID=2759023 RepID=A0ABQ3MWP1_9BACI|nr:hypothetical protein [Neobacillus kokaensis]GHH96842.1 hypothetical protein AM1BK_03850 [Neobacillus kokaensis]